MPESNSTELFEAIIKDNVKLVKEICNRNITLQDTVNEDNETAGHIAARTGNLALLNYLLTKDFSLLDCKDKWGQTIVLLAARKGFVYMVRHLVDELRLDLNSPKYHMRGDTPIHVAAGDGQVNMVKWYVEDFKHIKGNPNLRNARGETIAMSAIKGRQHEVLQYILEDGMGNPLLLDYQGNNVLFHGVFMGDILVAKYLLDAMAILYNIDDKNYAGLTVLFISARLGHLEMVKYFVEQRNATIDLPNNMGWTPLHEAACEGHLDVVKYLVEKKADTTRKEMQGRTPLDVAKGKGVVSFLQTFVRPRTRRSVSSAFFKQSPSSRVDDRAIFSSYSSLHLDDVSAVPVNMTSRISCALEAEVKSGDAMPTFFNTSVDSWLLLANVFAGQSNGSYSRKRHEALLSPEEMIRARMDPEAVRAVHELPDDFRR